MPLDRSDHELLNVKFRDLADAVDSLRNTVNDVANALIRLPNEHERRRYELLKAAATIMAADMRNHFDTWSSGFDHANYVGQAECLLEEIEKREKAEGQV